MFCPRCGKFHEDQVVSCDVCGMNLEFITLFDAEDMFSDSRKTEMRKERARRLFWSAENAVGLEGAARIMRRAQRTARGAV